MECFGRQRGECFLFEWSVFCPCEKYSECFSHNTNKPLRSGFRRGVILALQRLGKRKDAGSTLRLVSFCSLNNCGVYGHCLVTVPIIRTVNDSLQSHGCVMHTATNPEQRNCSMYSHLVEIPTYLIIIYALTHWLTQFVTGRH